MQPLKTLKLGTLNKAMQIKRPLLAGSGTVLFMDGFILMLHKKINLWTVAPLVIGSGFIAYAMYQTQIRQFLNTHPKLQKIWRAGSMLFIAWLVSLGYFAWLLSQYSNNQNHALPVRAIIVLGSGVKDGQPTPTLANRLDAAVSLIRNNPQSVIILSGGLDFSEHDTEAAVMAHYLNQQHHIAKSNMALESQSTSTELNLKNSQPILHHHKIGLDEPIAIVTSDFHTLRAAAIAKKQGYQNIVLISAPTPALIRYNVWLREYFAFISGWVLREF